MILRLMGRRCAVFLGLVAVSLAGCGGAPQPGVTGKVSYKGAPADGAVVVFHPRSQAAKDAVRIACVVAADGTFILKTRSGEPVPPGDYDVTVIWEKPIPPAARKLNGDDRADVFQGRYARPGDSGLSATIQPGQTELPSFDLK